MAKYDMQLVHLVKMRLMMKNLIMKNGLKKTRDHYERKLKGLWTMQNWRYVTFIMIMYVRYLALFPWLLHFKGSKRVRNTGKALLHSSCEWMPDGHR